MDESQLFLGAMDRYDFKLVGKKEMYIPYNNFKTADTSQCPTNVIFKKNHLNPDCVRWELHRTWHVTATLKPGFRHIYHKRDFWYDEDAPGAGVADNYDSAGKLYRTTYVITYPMYEGSGIMTDGFAVMDLNTGVLHMNGDYTASPVGGMVVVPPQPDAFYSPESLAAEGVR